METPPISVLMPVYNCEKFVADAVRSILEQTFTEFEFIIIDDASTDSTAEVIRQFTDQRIIFIQKPKNTGYTDSLNHGLGLAKGKYIARMDGDDVSLPSRFEAQINMMEANPDIMVCGTWLQILGTDKIIKNPEHHEEILIQMLLKNPIGHPSVMIRKDAFHGINYDKAKEPAEDYDLWSRMIWNGRFHNIQKPLLSYRLHTQQVSSVKSIRQQRHFNESRLELFKRLEYDTAIFSDALLLKVLLRDFQLSADEFRLILKWFREIKTANDTGRIFELHGFSQVVALIRYRFLEGFFWRNKFQANNLRLFLHLPGELMYIVFKMYMRNLMHRLKRKLRFSD